MKPHSEVVKLVKKAGATRVGNLVSNVPAELAAVGLAEPETTAPGDASLIFAEGAGKLHIYAVQDLPNVKAG